MPRILIDSVNIRRLSDCAKPRYEQSKSRRYFSHQLLVKAEMILLHGRVEKEQIGGHDHGTGNKEDSPGERSN